METNFMDLGPLTKLKESLEVANNNTNNMLCKLKEFDTRLIALDKKMAPIQNSTSKLSTAKNNIGLTLIEIQKTNEYFRLASENSGIITKGMRGNYQNFFEAVERISSAKKYFDQHRDMKSSGAALVNIDIMIKKAMSHCVEEAERIYKSCGKAYEFNPDGTADETYQALNPMNETTAVAIKQICDCLVAHDITTHFNIYLSHRTTIIKSELRNFEEENRPLTNSHSPSMSNIPLVEYITDGSMIYTRGNLFFPQYYNIAFTMLRGEFLLWNSSLPVHSAESSAIFTSICEIFISEINRVTTPYLHIQSNQTPTNAKKKTGPVAIQQKTNLLLIRLDLLDIFLSNFMEFRDLCSPDDNNKFQQQKQSMNSAVAALYTYRDTLVKSCVIAIEDVLKAIRLTQTQIGSQSTISSLTELHPITGYVLCFCKEIIEFETIYQEMLEISSEIQVSTSHIPKTTIGLESFVVDGLMIRLQERVNADSPIKPNSDQDDFETQKQNLISLLKRHVFMLNNLDVIAVHLRGRLSGIISPNRKEGRISVMKNFSIHGSKGGSASGMDPGTPIEQLTATYHSIEGRIQIEVNELCNGLSSFALNCLNLEAVEATAAAKANNSFSFTNSMKSSSDQLLHKQLKICFGNFNELMDTIIKIHDEWRISSKDLRERIHSQLTLQIMEPYTQFFQQYSLIPFSKKNKEHYLRYPPTNIEKILTSIFM